MKKGYLTGTHRSRSPRETLADYARWMPRLGITRLANLTGLDTIGLPVYTAIRPNARALATSQGKGCDIDSAKVSALMESIESWHAEHIAQPLRWESYLALRDAVPVVDVTRLPLRTDGELYPDLPMLWIEGYDLLQQQPTWVPYETVSTNYVYPPHCTYTFFQGSNGLASGNHLLEAVVHGLCEVIERDATALWYANDELRRVDLATVEDHCCQQVLDLLDRAGVYAAVWDITSDTGLPTYACTVLERPDRPTGRGLGSYNGFGCHLAPAIALLRALTEAVQSRVTCIAGSRDDLFRDVYHRQEDEDRLPALWDEIAYTNALTSLAAYPSLATESFEEDIAFLLTALHQIDIESAVVVDLTKPEIGIPVVKVVVPGLEGPTELECRPGQRVTRMLKEQAQ
jgi:ribosomal protein S12 methylthiotransferase accessory factor